MKILKYVLIFLVLLVLFLVVKGLMTPFVSYESKVAVDKPVEEVWAVMNDQTKLPEWIDGYLRNEHVSGTPNTVGAISNVYIDDKGKEMMMQETITAIEKNKRIAMTFSMDGFMDMEYEMLLTKENGKTLVTSSSKNSGTGIFGKIMVSLMPTMMKAQEDKNMQNFKKVVEENTKIYFSEPKAQAASTELK